MIIQLIMQMLVSLPGIIIALTFHEYAHALAAYSMGDNTAKNMGRLTVDPTKHIDPIGFLMLFVMHFGWAKPVQVNENNFKNKKFGVFLVSIAGIAMNLFLALIFTLIYHYTTDIIDIDAYKTVIAQVIWINLTIAAFNLLPIPPLDGSKIISALLPLKQRLVLYKYESYGSIILIILLLTGYMSKLIYPIVNFFKFIIIHKILTFIA